MGVIVFASTSTSICKNFSNGNTGFYTYLIEVFSFHKSRTGSGRISACGGNGYGGGGGGRVSVNVFSRHYDPEIFVHGETQYVLWLWLAPFIFF